MVGIHILHTLIQQFDTRVGPVSASVDNEIGVPAYWLPRHLRASAPALTHDLAKSTPCECGCSLT